MPKRNPYSFNKRIAQRRHLDTLYDKNIDLMYDKNGNPTQLRKLINYIIAKIELDEFDYKYIGGINQEIRYQRRLKDHGTLKPVSKKKLKNKKSHKNWEANKKARESQERFLKAVEEFYREDPERARREEERRHREEENVHNRYRKIMLSFIHMDRRHLKMRLLPYYPDKNQ